MMKKNIIGVLMIIGGIFLGLYVGLWLCFIGGIIQIIQEIRADILVPLYIGYGIIRIVLAGFLGVVSSLVLIIPGMVMMEY